MGSRWSPGAPATSWSRSAPSPGFRCSPRSRVRPASPSGWPTRPGSPWRRCCAAAASTSTATRSACGNNLRLPGRTREPTVDQEAPAGHRLLLPGTFSSRGVLCMATVTRRGFLSLAGVGTAGVLVGSELGFDLAQATEIKQQLRIAGATEARSVCPYCAVGCSIIAYTRKQSDGSVKVLQIEGDPDSPVN